LPQVSPGGRTGETYEVPSDSPSLAWEEKRALIIGRASPEPSKKHIETVCTGAITADGQLLRLYPITFRYLDENQKYRLWTWASFQAAKDPKDPRKESYRVKEGSISILSEVQSNSERFSLLRGGIVSDRETLDQLYRHDWTSLGIVKIEYIDLTASMPTKNWAQEKPYIKQSHLLVELKPLEQIPIQMKLKFRCSNSTSCRTHRCTLIAWEYMEAFRQFRGKYGSPLEAFHRVKEAIIARYFPSSKDSYALLGMHRWYHAWLVGQLYSFDKQMQERLF
jgi:hypothetical protein